MDEIYKKYFIKSNYRCLVITAEMKLELIDLTDVTSLVSVTLLTREVISLKVLYVVF